MKQIIGDARMRILIWLKYHFLSAIPHWFKKIVHSPAAQGAYTTFKQKYQNLTLVEILNHSAIQYETKY